MGTAAAQQGLCLWAVRPSFSLWLIACLQGLSELRMLLLGLSFFICTMGLAVVLSHGMDLEQKSLVSFGYVEK